MGKRSRAKALKKAQTLSTKNRLQQDWQALVKYHQQLPKFAGKFQGTTTGRMTIHRPPVMELRPRMAGKVTEAGMRLGMLDVDLSEIERRFEGMKNNGTLTKAQVYTGEKVLGIATMHKSNLVPVFSQQEAEDAAKMRRS